jgi:hypothetical protein
LGVFDLKKSKPPSTESQATESQDMRQKVVLVRPKDLQDETLRALAKKMFEQLKANSKKP